MMCRGKKRGRDGGCDEAGVDPALDAGAARERTDVVTDPSRGNIQKRCVSSIDAISVRPGSRCAIGPGDDYQLGL